MSKIVTFEQAKRLKELGFNQKCSKHYSLDGILHNSKQLLTHKSLRSGGCLAPTIPDALDFIREERRVICAIDVDYFDGYYYTGKYKQRHLIKFSYTDSFDDHYNAESALLNAVLEYLEKGGENV